MGTKEGIQVRHWHGIMGHGRTVAPVVLALLVGAIPSVAQELPDVAGALAITSGELRQGSPHGEEREGDGQIASVSPKPVATNHELLKKYVWSTLGFEGALSATLGSGLDQWKASPPEWGTGAPGYARRWASEYAESAIADTAKYAVARLFHHDPSFTRCECPGFARRLRHAVNSPFMARRRDGTRVPSVASLAGFLAGNVISASTWYPAPLGTRDGLRHGALSLVSKIGMDVFKEFRPRRSK
jgi:hypothetical protein